MWMIQAESKKKDSLREMNEKVEVKEEWYNYLSQV